MKWDAPFYRLPLRFDSQTLADEVAALPADAWVSHPQRFTGNDYVPLVTPSGIITNEFAGPMAATSFLEQCPYMTEVLATLDCVWGRTRLMGLVAGATVPPHVDTNYYWRTHIRVHIPILTNPDVRFTCGEETVHMKSGECWVFDTFRPHEVANDGKDKRIHLVADTVGGERLWDLMHAARQPGMATRDPERVARGSTAGGRLRLERANFPVIMTPWELRRLTDELLEMTEAAPARETVALMLDRLAIGWAALWAEFESDAQGLPHYRQLATGTLRALDGIPRANELKLANGITLFAVLHRAVFDNLVESDRVRESKQAAREAAERRLAS